MKIKVTTCNAEVKMKGKCYTVHVNGNRHVDLEVFGELKSQMLDMDDPEPCYMTITVDEKEYLLKLSFNQPYGTDYGGFPSALMEIKELGTGIVLGTTNVRVSQSFKSGPYFSYHQLSINRMRPRVIKEFAKWLVLKN